jgi:hypothetical protein
MQPGPSHHQQVGQRLRSFSRLLVGHAMYGNNGDPRPLDCLAMAAADFAGAAVVFQALFPFTE